MRTDGQAQPAFATSYAVLLHLGHCFVIEAHSI